MWDAMIAALEEHVLEQRSALEDALAVRLGGRAAEDLIFGTPSTGAHDDLTSATGLATRMVRERGMSPRIGNLAWGPRGPVFFGEELIHTREYSDQTARIIDEEVTRILDEQAQRARQVLEQHRQALEAVATALLAHETIDGREVARLVADAERPEVGAELAPATRSAAALRTPSST
jgi:cell division protease FtsH